MTFFVADAAVAVRGAAAFFTTVVVLLPSLASLVALTRRPIRVPGLELAAAVVGFRARVAPPAGAVLAWDGVAVGFRWIAGRAPLAFSTMLERSPVAAADRAVPVAFRGEPGRARLFVGDAGRSRFTRREFEDVGDRTCAGRTLPLVAVPALTRFFAVSAYSNSFSLSPASSSLNYSSAMCVELLPGRRHIPQTFLSSRTGLHPPALSSSPRLSCANRHVLGWHGRRARC